jgi:2,5-diketo-D-gluconate reductase A
VNRLSCHYHRPMADPDTSDRLVRLRGGVSMPRLGFGTWPLVGPAATRAVTQALECGYRLVDTAENYDNEAAVGAALRASALRRDEVFVTTKFNRQWHDEDLVRTALQRSIDRLGLEYVDMLMIHWPNPAHGRYVGAWRGMVRLLAEKRVRAIGTSNFKPAHLARIIGETGMSPAVNQIQVNPAFPRTADREFAGELGIVTQSWAPLGGGRDSYLRTSPALGDLARRHGRTPAQIIIRWHIQQGLAAVVKAASPEHMRQNLNIFDFVLEAGDMAAIGDLRRTDAAPVDSDVAGH